ncbi:MAG: LPS assembly lipoprotein LptE [Inhella sp.]
MQRRALLFAAPLALSLAGCGFQLRGAPSFAFERLALTGFAPRSPVREALERQISQLPLKLVSVAQAQVVLEVLREKQFRVAVASTPAALVREWQLTLELDYRLTTAGEEVLLPTTQLRISRDLSTTEARALAKEQEEDLLNRAMRQEAVGLLLRRLSAVRPR